MLLISFDIWFLLKVFKELAPTVLPGVPTASAAAATHVNMDAHMKIPFK